MTSFFFVKTKKHRQIKPFPPGAKNLWRLVEKEWVIQWSGYHRREGYFEYFPILKIFPKGESFMLPQFGVPLSMPSVETPLHNIGSWTLNAWGLHYSNVAGEEVNHVKGAALSQNSCRLALWQQQAYIVLFYQSKQEQNLARISTVSIGKGKHCS